MTNEIFTMDCIQLMSLLPDEYVNCIVTSPPYWNTKSYAFWPTYEQYLEDVRLWVAELYRILEPGRYCFWVIPDKLPFPPRINGTRERLYLPIHSDTERAASSSGFVAEFSIVWKKPHGTQKMFGSYPYPPTIIHTPMTERICVWRKPGKYVRRSKEIKENSRLTKREWVDFAQDVWMINPETKQKHPAPFPEEIVRRILTLWSFVDDLVFDPFMGSGTTAVVAKEMQRNYLGCDIHEEYVEYARQRIKCLNADALNAKVKRDERL